jgi:hypothetical protein
MGIEDDRKRLDDTTEEKNVSHRPTQTCGNDVLPQRLPKLAQVARACLGVSSAGAQAAKICG